jgi:5-methylcytosine-specific restriction protein A
MFVQGREYRRRDLHSVYGGQRQGGISTPAGRSLILLFTGDVGHQYGYQDGWTADGLFLYTGEGQRGDMEFVRGNRAVRDHVAEGKDLYLFRYKRKGYVQYLDQMVCTGFHERLGPDADGLERGMIVFELAPLDAFEHVEMLEMDEVKSSSARTLSALRERAMVSEGYAASPRERLTLAYERSAAVRAYVLTRAAGVCEGCREAAPFQTEAGRPYLETHHIRRLSDGGPDQPRWVVALCPNCHRRAHYGEGRIGFNSELAHRVGQLESGLG